MIRGFKGNHVTTAEEWLIDYSLKTGNSIDINTDLLDMPIRFNGEEVDAFILDVLDNKLVIQLSLPLRERFDYMSNRYETSHTRKLINSNEFLNRFNPEFVKHIQLTAVHTEDYVRTDKLWLLSHEEINKHSYSLRLNHKCHAFEMFKTIDLEAYSRMLLNKHKTKGWLLRSAYSDTYYDISSIFVSFVDYDGIVSYDHAYSTYYGALFPACTITSLK